MYNYLCISNSVASQIVQVFLCVFTVFTKEAHLAEPHGLSVLELGQVLDSVVWKHETRRYNAVLNNIHEDVKIIVTASAVVVKFFTVTTKILSRKANKRFINSNPHPHEYLGVERSCVNHDITTSRL